MFYFCIEDNIVTTIMPYLPNVPDSIEVVEVTDEEYNSIKEDTHTFDIKSKKVIPRTAKYLQDKKLAAEVDKVNLEQREFLASTDWKILRHLRQKALKVPTTLTESEYLALEEARQAAATKISN